MTQYSLKRSWPFEDSGQGSSADVLTLDFEQFNDILGENTCFGSIIGEDAQVTKEVYPHNLLSQSFDLVKEGDYFAVSDGIRTFARLTKGLSKTLHALDGGPHVRLRAYLPGDAMRTNHLFVQDLLPVEINLYGARDDAKKIGAILSEMGTFLQFPQYGLESVEYHNPHFFRVEGYSEQIPIETPLPSRQDQDQVENFGQDRDDEGEGDASDVVESILDSLSYHTILRDSPVDYRIRTVLLPHQKEAIDFVSGRELGNIPSELSLWKYNDMDADEPFYQHIFTGAKRPRQEEAEGGIIADDMGLGKSLVILSTIASSLDRAESFVASESQPNSTEQQYKTPSRATLILVPSSLLVGNWIDEVRKHTSGSISIHQHLGRERHKEIHLLLQRDIIFTTYATVAIEFSRGKSALAKINWFRIVLDEAHDIRNRHTNQFKAVTQLTGKHRWCLTGTPIQNSLEDLGALVSFLKVPVLEKPSTFRKFITSPAASLSRDRFRNLQILLQTICIRRTKQLLNLPPPIPSIREVHLTPLERQAYDHLMYQAQIQIQKAVSGHIKNRINSIVLDSLLKLRLFCNNGSASNVLEISPTGLPSDSDEALTYLQQRELDACVYCSAMIYSISSSDDTNGGTFISSCCHLVCPNCTPKHCAENNRCPICVSGHEQTIPWISQPPNIQSHPHSNPFPTGRYPSKLLALLSDIGTDTGHKSIVFSCWKKTLDLVGQLLSTNGIQHRIIHGGCSLTQRNTVLKEFQSRHGPDILLMTLGTGAVGLNLAVASRIFLLEPQWNPSIEDQAIGRALRLGQTAQVVIIRYIVADTVEQAGVLSRQKRKIQLAGGGFGKAKDMPAETLQSLLHTFNVEGLGMSVPDTEAPGVPIRKDYWPRA